MSIASLTPLLGAALAVSQPPSATECAAIPGWEQVVAAEDVRWIVVGEMHGTVETPAIFADAVCLTAEARGPVVVALETPTNDQTPIDAFLASDGARQARDAFLGALTWNSEFKDGRSSEAMFALFERLREMQREGRVAHVIAFQDTSPAPDLMPEEGVYDQGPYEQRLAAIVRDAGASGATVLVLVGGSHAQKSQVDPGTPDRKPFKPMTAHLPPEQTLALYAQGNGGSAWNCQADGCGPHETRAAREPLERGLALSPEKGGTYDGLLNIGAATTASPPQQVP